MYKVTLINYDFDDIYYQMKYAEFKEDFKADRDGLREWEEPKPPVKEQHTYKFVTREEANLYVNQDSVQEHFDSVETVEISD